MSQSFLAAARQGKNHWWRYLLGITTILFFTMILGSIATVVFAIYCCGISFQDILGAGVTNGKFDKLTDSPSMGGYLTTNISFLFGIAGIFLAVAGLHQRNFASLVRADSKIRWRRILTGALVWATISLVVAAIDYGTNPQDYTWSFQPIWWLIVPVALVITPIQTSCEELFFRGYLMQGMALLTHNKLVLILINGILFMIPHLGNPEMQRGPLLGLDYLIAGAMLAAIAIRDNGLELALGIHAANNLQVILFNTKDSALPFPSLWYVKVTNEPIIDIIITTLEYSLFYYIFFGRKSDPSLKNQ